MGMLLMMFPLPFALVPLFCVVMTLLGLFRSSIKLVRCSLVLLLVHLVPNVFLFAIFTPAFVPPTLSGVLIALPIWCYLPITLLFIALSFYRSRFLSKKLLLPLGS